MKHSRFSEEQIISILHGAEQGDQTIGAVCLNQTVLAYGIARIFQNANCWWFFIEISVALEPHPITCRV